MSECVSANNDPYEMMGVIDLCNACIAADNCSDINMGDYPYVTSSEPLPYAACSLGFPTQKINRIYGAAKIYDTRSGEDPLFPSSLLRDRVLVRIADVGSEYGVTTGRRRKVN